MHLVVVGVEKIGVWGEEGRSWISEIGRNLMEKSSENKSKRIWYK